MFAKITLIVIIIIENSINWNDVKEGIIENWINKFIKFNIFGGVKNRLLILSLVIAALMNFNIVEREKNWRMEEKTDSIYD